MIKGVNKQIIEVNNPDSIYFERAVFYLRPGVKKLPAEISGREIDRFMYGEDRSMRKQRRRLHIGRLLIYAVLLAAVIMLLLLLI